MLFQWFYQLAWLAALSWKVAAEDKDGIKSIPVSIVSTMELTNTPRIMLIVWLVTDA